MEGDSWPPGQLPVIISSYFHTNRAYLLTPYGPRAALSDSPVDGVGYIYQRPFAYSRQYSAIHKIFRSLTVFTTTAIDIAFLLPDPDSLYTEIFDILPCEASVNMPQHTCAHLYGHACMNPAEGDSKLCHSCQAYPDHCKEEHPAKDSSTQSEHVAKVRNLFSTYYRLDR